MVSVETFFALFSYRFPLIFISAKVYLVKPTGCHKQVALKLTSKRRKTLNKEEPAVPVPTINNAAKRSRLRFNFAPLSEEAQIHCNFKHENIVQVIYLILIQNSTLSLIWHNICLQCFFIYSFQTDLWLPGGK